MSCPIRVPSRSVTMPRTHGPVPGMPGGSSRLPYDGGNSTVRSMKTVLQKLYGVGIGVLLLGLADSGCVMVPDENEPPAASQAEVQYLREEMRRMNDRLQASEAQVGDIQRAAYSAEASRPATASSAEVAALREQIEILRRQIRELDAARAADKREIYDDISKKVAEIVKKSIPAAPAPQKKSSQQTGYEHVVQTGETLSAIAQAYGVRMDTILKANNIQNANSIRVGQKLFIPD